MSTKKSWLNGYPLFNAQDMTATTTSIETDVTNYETAEIFIDWTASAVSGNLEVQALYNRSGLWKPLPGLETIAITGTSGTHNVILKIVPFGKLRLKYTRTSGSCILNATITAKGA